ncbi:Norsolorinic acid reductase B [Cladobotryum mycophilum]|uniref:Norsolorinic acid reductase B n=1 Tax=Cladobotryum mycophilum TaxID=491253 RepID=A0ABR0S6X6_9HYPO
MADKRADLVKPNWLPQTTHFYKNQGPRTISQPADFLKTYQSNTNKMSAAFPKVGPPKSPLNRYRMLSPTAAVRVSPLCLGAMNFGSGWKDFLGECDKQQSEAILDFFFEQGGNFIDTASNYQFGESEQIIGDWMKRRGNRDEMVIATKYTTNYRRGPSNTPDIMANYTGNGAKSLHLSVNDSLKKLQTDYIDLLYVHWWDYATDVAELMQSLNHLVVSGKVLYLGISDTPAWVVSKANEYARNHGLRQFSVYQGRWSAAEREMERDIIPMCRAENMGIAPWGALGGGRFKTEEQLQTQDRRKVEVTDVDIKISKVLETIAARKSTVITSVALAYVMHKTPYVFPIVGGRKVEHLKANVEALTLALTEEEITEIDDAVPFNVGFPHNVLWGAKIPDNEQKLWLVEYAANMEYVPHTKPIKPTKLGE